MYGCYLCMWLQLVNVQRERERALKPSPVIGPFCGIKIWYLASNASQTCSMLLACSTMKYDMSMFHSEYTVAMILDLASKVIAEKMVINLNLVYGNKLSCVFFGYVFSLNYQWCSG